MFTVTSIKYCQRSFSPHPVIFPPYLKDRLVFFVSALGLGIPYRRGVHTQSALGSSLRRDILDTHVSSRGGGRTLLHGLTCLQNWIQSQSLPFIRRNSPLCRCETYIINYAWFYLFTLSNARKVY